MTDDISNDPEFNPIEPIEKDHRGSIMRELESWERVIDGLKMAADGARHLARHRSPDAWNKLALHLDSVRKAVIRDGGFDRPTDGTDSLAQWGGEGMTFTTAHSRMMDGLKMAAGGADQIAQVQRKDIKWVQYAMHLRKMKDKARTLAMSGSPLVTEQGWRNMASGLVVPARLN